jgi:hypothetical protein
MRYVRSQIGIRSRLAILLIAPVLTHCEVKTQVTEHASLATESAGLESVSNITCTSAQITWKSASGAVLYSVFNSTEATPVFVTNLGSSSTSYTISGLSPAQSYLFRVRTIDANGNSDSNPQDFVVSTLSEENCKYFTTVLADHPLAYWRLGEGSGSMTAVDSSGNGYHGTYLGEVSLGNAGPLKNDVNTAASFSGSSSYVLLPTTLRIPYQSPISIEFWAYTSSADLQMSSAFTIGNNNSAGNRCQSHVPWTNGTMYWDYGNIATTGRLTTVYTSYLGKWTHVVLVSEGKNGKFKAIYLNGVKVASSTVSSDGPLIELVGGMIGGTPSAGQLHKGLLSEFAVYNAVLSAEQVSAHYKAAGY